MRPNQQEHQTRRKAVRLVNFVVRRMNPFALMRGGMIGAAAVAASTVVLLLSLGLTSSSGLAGLIISILIYGLTLAVVAGLAWASDITSIPLQHGLLYVAAVMDLSSRNVSPWWLSNTFTGDFCVVALDAALVRTRPRIFNTDQVAQFTALAFVSQRAS